MLDTKMMANSVNGAVLVQIHTDWVDITTFWNAYAKDDGGADYTADHQPGTELVVLG